MTDDDKRNLAVRLLEQAADKGAAKGLGAEDMLQGMLGIYLATRIGFQGLLIPAILDEVRKRAEETAGWLQGVEVELGPCLGKGDN